MPKKILVVDDEPGMCDLLRERFESIGYECLTAENGQTACNLAKAEHPSIIILDLVMPLWSGLRTYQALKSDPDTKDIRIVVYTAQDEESVMESGIEALDIVDYVLKPLDLQSLTYLVNKTIDSL